VNIDLTHPYFITKRCIWLTWTLTSVHPDPFQALLTKEHTRKKQTHTDKVYDGHRVKSISQRSWYSKKYLVNTRSFTPSPWWVFVRKRGYVRVYTCVGERTHECNWMYIYFDLHIYIYIHTYMYTYIYIWICM